MVGRHELLAAPDEALLHLVEERLDEVVLVLRAELLARGQRRLELAARLVLFHRPMMAHRPTKDLL